MTKDVLSAYSVTDLCSVVRGGQILLESIQGMRADDVRAIERYIFRCKCELFRRVKLHTGALPRNIDSLLNLK